MESNKTTINTTHSNKNDDTKAIKHSSPYSISRYVITTEQYKYQTSWDYIEQCDLEQVELVMQKVLQDHKLDEYQRAEILFKYGRRRQALLHYPTKYTSELREKTIEMNQHLSQKCIQAGRVMLEVLRMAKERGLDSVRLLLSLDVRVSAEQPWDADELERAMVSEIMDYRLVVKSYYNKETDTEEYSDRNKILGLKGDDDNWNECLPEPWSEGMQLTFPFDRIRDGIPLAWERITQIRNYDILIDETYDL